MHIDLSTSWKLKITSRVEKDKLLNVNWCKCVKLTARVTRFDTINLINIYLTSVKELLLCNVQLQIIHLWSLDLYNAYKAFVYENNKCQKKSLLILLCRYFFISPSYRFPTLSESFIACINKMNLHMNMHEYSSFERIWL